MTVVRHFLEDGKELTHEEREAARRRIQEAARRPYVHDPDSPLLTEKQLSEFYAVNFGSMRERGRVMRREAAGRGSLARL